MPPDSHAYDTHDASELDDSYQSLSPLAIASVLISLASPVVFVWPLLLVVPCVAAALALVALGKIANSDGALVGRGAALTALAFSVLSLSAWLTQELTYNSLMHAQAEPIAEAWLQCLQQRDTEAAYLMTVDLRTRAAALAYLQSDKRNAEDAEGRKPKGPSEIDFAKNVREFRDGLEERMLLADAGIDAYHLVQPGRVVKAGAQSTVVFLTYRVRFADGESRPYLVRLEQRERKQDPPFWRVITAELDQPHA